MINILSDIANERKSELLILTMRAITVRDGGPGSGFFGHKGRPGMVGGSAKSGGGSSKILKDKLPDNLILDVRKDARLLEKYGKSFSTFLSKISLSNWDITTRVNRVIGGGAGVFKSREDRDAADELFEKLKADATNNPDILNSKEYRDLQRKLLQDDYLCDMYEILADKYGLPENEEIKSSDIVEENKKQTSEAENKENKEAAKEELMDYNQPIGTEKINVKLNKEADYSDLLKSKLSRYSKFNNILGFTPNGDANLFAYVKNVPIRYNTALNDIKVNNKERLKKIIDDSPFSYSEIPQIAGWVNRQLAEEIQRRRTGEGDGNISDLDEKGEGLLIDYALINNYDFIQQIKDKITESEMRSSLRGFLTDNRSKHNLNKGDTINWIINSIYDNNEILKDNGTLDSLLEYGFGNKTPSYNKDEILEAMKNKDIGLVLVELYCNMDLRENKTRLNLLENFINEHKDNINSVSLYDSYKSVNDMISFDNDLMEAVGRNRLVRAKRNDDYTFSNYYVPRREKLIEDAKKSGLSDEEYLKKLKTELLQTIEKSKDVDFINLDNNGLILLHDFNIFSNYVELKNTSIDGFKDWVYKQIEARGMDEKTKRLWDDELKRYKRDPDGFGSDSAIYGSYTYYKNNSPNGLINKDFDKSLEYAKTGPLLTEYNNAFQNNGLKAKEYLNNRGGYREYSTYNNLLGHLGDYLGKDIPNGKLIYNPESLPVVNGNYDKYVDRLKKEAANYEMSLEEYTENLGDELKHRLSEKEDKDTGNINFNREDMELLHDYNLLKSNKELDDFIDTSTEFGSWLEGAVLEGAFLDDDNTDSNLPAGIEDYKKIVQDFKKNRNEYLKDWLEYKAGGQTLTEETINSAGRLTPAFARYNSYNGHSFKDRLLDANKLFDNELELEVNYYNDKKNGDTYLEELENFERGSLILSDKEFEGKLKSGEELKKSLIGNKDFQKYLSKEYSEYKDNINELINNSSPEELENIAKTYTNALTYWANKNPEERAKNEFGDITEAFESAFTYYNLGLIRRSDNKRLKEFTGLELKKAPITVNLSRPDFLSNDKMKKSIIDGIVNELSNKYKLPEKAAEVVKKNYAAFGNNFYRNYKTSEKLTDEELKEEFNSALDEVKSADTYKGILNKCKVLIGIYDYMNNKEFNKCSNPKTYDIAHRSKSGRVVEGYRKVASLPDIDSNYISSRAVDELNISSKNKFSNKTGDAIKRLSSVLKSINPNNAHIYHNVHMASREQKKVKNHGELHSGMSRNDLLNRIVKPFERAFGVVEKDNDGRYDRHSFSHDIHKIAMGKLKPGSLTALQDSDVNDITGESLAGIFSAMTISGEHYTNILGANVRGIGNMVRLVTAMAPTYKGTLYRAENKMNMDRDYANLKVGDRISLDAQHFTYSETFMFEGFERGCSAMEMFGEKEPCILKIVGDIPFFCAEPFTYESKIHEHEGFVSGFLKVKAINRKMNSKLNEKYTEYELEYDWDALADYIKLNAKELASIYGLYKNIAELTKNRKQKDSNSINSKLIDTLISIKSKDDLYNYIKHIRRNRKLELFITKIRDGGKGSGFFGHKGRPGMVVGSSKEGGSKVLKGKLDDNKILDARKDERLLNKYGKSYSTFLSSISLGNWDITTRINRVIDVGAGVFNSREDRDKADELFEKLKKEAENNPELKNTKEYKNLNRRLLQDDYLCDLYEILSDKYGLPENEEIKSSDIKEMRRNG